ncbi:hypothetical protein AB0A84_18850 [Streptomyces albidoflavus]
MNTLSVRALLVGGMLAGLAAGLVALLVGSREGGVRRGPTR